MSMIFKIYSDFFIFILVSLHLKVIRSLHKKKTKLYWSGMNYFNDDLGIHGHTQWTHNSL